MTSPSSLCILLLIHCFLDIITIALLPIQIIVIFQINNIPGDSENADSINVEDGNNVSSTVESGVVVMNIQDRVDGGNIRVGSAAQMSGREAIAGCARGQRGSTSHW